MLLTQCISIVSLSEPVFQYTYPKNAPISVAGMACQMLPWISPKISPDTRMAIIGFVLARRPLRIIPLHSHSSNIGANMETDRIDNHSGAFRRRSMAASRSEDISGSN